MPSSKRGNSKRSSAHDMELKKDLLDRFHDPDKKVCEIIPTNTTKKLDQFWVYRPKTSRECMNYNISQTDAKMDCGPTKIHIQQTRAEYERYPVDYVFNVEPPPPKKKKRPQHGRGPVWFYLDEIYKKKVEMMQAVYRREMEARLHRKAKCLEQEKYENHFALISQSGPDWYQELSPQQLATVDDLPNCIKMDAKAHTIINVQNNIAKLGLVLRPNHRHIERALKHCCQNPVEFLLILYQLIRPARKSYSLNDKLLLSAVTHLSMTLILRELHIRIPSPPPRKIIRIRVACPPKKKKKYKSPYLIPHTFVPDQAKPKTKVYKNRHIQYPESPYFSYIEELKHEVEPILETEEEDLVHPVGAKIKRPISEESAYSEADTNGLIEKALDEELALAQIRYNKLTDMKIVPRLLRPSIYRPCPPEKILRVQRYEDYSYNYSGITDDIKFLEEDVESLGCGVTCPTVEACMQVKMRKQLEDVPNSVTSEDEGEPGTHEDQKVPTMPQVNSTFISGGVAIDREGNAVPIIAGVVSPKDLVCKCNVDPSNNGPLVEINVEETGSSGAIKKARVCSCKKRIEKKLRKKKEIEDRKRLQRELCNCEQCQCLNNILRGSSSSDLSSLGSFVPPSDDLYKKEETQRLVTVKEQPPFHCHCKEMAEYRIDKIKERMTCEEKCGQKKEKPTYVISDSKLTEDAAIPIIAGVKTPRTCFCLDNYNKRIDKFEKNRQVEEAQFTLKSTQQRYVIGGVKQGPDGKPIYMLSCVAPDRLCKKCEETEELKKREEERIANMPVFPQGRQKYVISGVHKTPVGNAYIISGAIPTTDCCCMKIFDIFMKKHSMCLQLYDRFVEKVKTDTDQYMLDLPPICEAECAQSEPEDSEPLAEEELTTPPASTTLSSSQEEEVEDETDSSSSLPSECICGKERVEEDEEKDISTSVDVDMKKNDSAASKRSDGPSSVCGKRFILLEKFPTNPNHQLRILKLVVQVSCLDGYFKFQFKSKLATCNPICLICQQKALNVLAEDGFPLAKLPEVFKLPHFKIWLKMRCGQYFTQEDRKRFCMQQKVYWRNIEKCKVPLPILDLDMTPEEGRQYSWAEAKYVKELTDTLKETQNRRAKQEIINDGREYFPSMFHYEIPTKNFRECYFAYVPSKEESIFACRPWNNFEVTNYVLIRARRQGAGSESP